MQENHWHGSTMQNNRFTDNRCFRDDLAGAQDWLVEKLSEDRVDQPTSPRYGKLIREVRAYDGKSEAWEGNVAVPNPARAGYGVIMGYRIMSIDGACEDML